MSLTQLLSRDCTVIQRSPSGGSDDYGNIVPTETELDTVCELQQRRRDEPDAAGELSDTDWVAFFPAGTDINTGDALVVSGVEYEVVGDPWHARNPRTRVAGHVEVSLKKTGGRDEVS
jgi:hypothetical protein